MFKFVNTLSFALVLLSSNLLAQITLGPFTYYPNPSSGAFLGQVTIDGDPAAEDDLIAAFDEDGNCAGAAVFTMWAGDANIYGLAIYGDDATTPDFDEGMNPGTDGIMEDFYIQLYDASAEVIYTYPGSFSEWSNQNGGPMPAYNDWQQVYDFTTLQAGTPQFELSLNVEGFGNDLTFGFSPQASDGYDSGIDSYAPPAPPVGTMDAALGWDGERYYTQILNGSSGDLVEHVWDIQLQYDEDNQITLTWDNNGWSSLGTFILQDALGGDLVNVDMTDETSLTLTDPAFDILKLKVTPNGESEAMAFFAWEANYLGVTFTDQSIAGSLPDLTWNWDFGYGGDGSTEQNPTNTYDFEGTYEVTLTVTDGNGLSDSYTADVTVAAAVGPMAGFVYEMENITVTFTDISTAGSEDITGWSWEFGDG